MRESKQIENIINEKYGTNFKFKKLVNKNEVYISLQEVDFYVSRIISNIQYDIYRLQCISLKKFMNEIEDLEYVYHVNEKYIIFTDKYLPYGYAPIFEYKL
jgi:hypothetical protein